MKWRQLLRRTKLRSFCAETPNFLVVAFGFEANRVAATQPEQKIMIAARKSEQSKIFLSYSELLESSESLSKIAKEYFLNNFYLPWNDFHASTLVIGFFVT